MRRVISYTPESPGFDDKLMRWISSFEHCMILDSCYNESLPPDPYSRIQKIFAAGAVKIISSSCESSSFEQLKSFMQTEKDWYFGHFSYDLKNSIEKLSSSNPDSITFPDLSFFLPEILIIQNHQKYSFHLHPDSSYKEIESLLNAIDAHDSSHHSSSSKSALHRLIKPEIIGLQQAFQHRIPKDEYLATILEIQKHIARGDIYEANFCVEFFADCFKVDPFALYKELTHLSPAPFSGFYRHGNSSLMTASPERFLAKRGRKIISQPIKGTIRRHVDPKMDEKLKTQLKNDPKERAENVMIVDLVRNDLSRTARRGSVIVEELCEVYSFPLGHQMISTVSSELKEQHHPLDAIYCSFPMGSMTGAPKIKAMQLLDYYESTKRGLYSGSIGYFDPNGDFDFNVVIRGFSYESEKHYLNWMTGGAITSLSDPEKEYQECLLKASGMEKAFFSYLQKMIKSQE